mmetsp:Transcript_27488/g.58414  ORF Transcript_27488/g.58414 Transcript_27488/m.58414 type:complete len:394 (-) Transcript_27488:479-1660(-)
MRIRRVLRRLFRKQRVRSDRFGEAGAQGRSDGTALEKADADADAKADANADSGNNRDGPSHDVLSDDGRAHRPADARPHYGVPDAASPHGISDVPPHRAPPHAGADDVGAGDARERRVRDRPRVLREGVARLSRARSRGQVHQRLDVSGGVAPPGDEGALPIRHHRGVLRDQLRHPGLRHVRRVQTGYEPADPLAGDGNADVRAVAHARPHSVAVAPLARIARELLQGEVARVEQGRRLQRHVHERRRLPQVVVDAQQARLLLISNGRGVLRGAVPGPGVPAGQRVSEGRGLRNAQADGMGAGDSRADGAVAHDEADEEADGTSHQGRPVVRRTDGRKVRPELPGTEPVRRDPAAVGGGLPHGVRLLRVHAVEAARGLPHDPLADGRSPASHA